MFPAMKLHFEYQQPLLIFRFLLQLLQLVYNFSSHPVFLLMSQAAWLPKTSYFQALPGLSFTFDHGLRTPNEALFHPKTFRLGQTIWEDKFWGIWGMYFRMIYQHSFQYCESLVHVSMPLINHYFYKKLSLYIQIPSIYLGLGFEFGPQRIRNLTFACPQSMPLIFKNVRLGSAQHRYFWIN